MIIRRSERRRNKSAKAWKHQVGEGKSKRFPLGSGLKSHGGEGSLGQGKQGLDGHSILDSGWWGGRAQRSQSRAMAFREVPTAVRRGHTRPWTG